MAPELVNSCAWTMFENSFSRRKGYTSPPVQGKLEELSPTARTRLWDVFFEDVFKPHHKGGVGYGNPGSVSPNANELFRIFWKEFFGRPADEYPGFNEVLNLLKQQFLAGKWYFAFDVFELVFRVKNHLFDDPKRVAEKIKDALETENTAYTFLDDIFVERMAPQEVEAVEATLKASHEGVRVHLRSALQKLNDRENPDFRNSIKEAISAVEAACRHLSKQDNVTLVDALKALDKQRPFHPAFKGALSQLYGWTNDESGIRHAIKDADKVERADAQFMLVVCSAFVNYLLTR